MTENKSDSFTQQLTDILKDIVDDGVNPEIKTLEGRDKYVTEKVVEIKRLIGETLDSVRVAITTQQITDTKRDDETMQEFQDRMSRGVTGDESSQPDPSQDSGVVDTASQA